MAIRGAHLDIITTNPLTSAKWRRGSGEEELRSNHWQAQIKSPSPQPSPRASLRGEGVNYGGSVKMRPTRLDSAATASPNAAAAMEGERSRAESKKFASKSNSVPRVG